MELVIFPQTLYLRDVVIDNNKLEAGDVVNGYWYWKLIDNEEQAFDFYGNLKNKWKHKEFDKIVYIPRNKSSNDYNEVISWAENQPSITESLDDLLDRWEIEDINHKTHYSNFDFDDDIAF